MGFGPFGSTSLPLVGFQSWAISHTSHIQHKYSGLQFLLDCTSDNGVVVHQLYNVAATTGSFQLDHRNPFRSLSSQSVEQGEFCLNPQRLHVSSLKLSVLAAVQYPKFQQLAIISQATTWIKSNLYLIFKTISYQESSFWFKDKLIYSLEM